MKWFLHDSAHQEQVFRPPRHLQLNIKRHKMLTCLNQVKLHTIGNIPSLQTRKKTLMDSVL